MNTKKLLYLLPFIFLLFSCNKEDYIFHLKSVKLNEYSQRNHLSEQKLYVKVFSNESAIALAQTDGYPSNLPLPATLKMYPAVDMNLYDSPYYLELWGSEQGYIARCDINMDDYKIIFPIDMEVENEELNVSILGSWE